MAVVSKTALVTFDRNRYSVPHQYVGQKVMIKATWNQVRIESAQEVIASHQRCYGRGQAILELEHYLPVLAQKPRAAKNAAVVRQLGSVWEEARQVLCGQRTDGYRELVKILLLHRSYPHHVLTAALKEALALGRPTATVVRQILLNASCKKPPQLPVSEALAGYVVEAADLARYDALLKEASQ